ncbi:hypothetical protein O6H91_14G045600 [Diphasiastrum complanatum]|uniref:Uncharacterized protein n=1 Tax=Diphasiastrum complanatum TaxID=34168 RepID=A0ACC2BP51_DIPCM|nr:hypothetical protein O6H91_14G045600 [Diphasiastrum complanatum]
MATVFACLILPTVPPISTTNLTRAPIYSFDPKFIPLYHESLNALLHHFPTNSTLENQATFSPLLSIRQPHLLSHLIALAHIKFMLLNNLGITKNVFSSFSKYLVVNRPLFFLNFY